MTKEGKLVADQSSHQVGQMLRGAFQEGRKMLGFFLTGDHSPSEASVENEIKENADENSLQEELQAIRAQLSELAESKKLPAVQAISPIVIENAMERVYYWAQERENQVLNERLKQTEKKLGLSQVEILMELRSLAEKQAKGIVQAETREKALQNQLKALQRWNMVLLASLFILILGIVGAGIYGAIYYGWMTPFK